MTSMKDFMTGKQWSSLLDWPSHFY